MGQLTMRARTIHVLPIHLCSRCSEKNTQMQANRTKSGKVLKVLSGSVLEWLNSHKSLIDNCVLTNRHATLTNLHNTTPCLNKTTHLWLTITLTYVNQFC